MERVHVRKTVTFHSKANYAVYKKKTKALLQKVVRISFAYSRFPWNFFNKSVGAAMVKKIGIKKNTPPKTKQKQSPNNIHLQSEASVSNTIGNCHSYQSF